MTMTRRTGSTTAMVTNDDDDDDDETREEESKPLSKSTTAIGKRTSPASVRVCVCVRIV